MPCIFAGLSFVGLCHGHFMKSTHDYPARSTYLKDLGTKGTRRAAAVRVARTLCAG